LPGDKVFSLLAAYNIPFAPWGIGMNALAAANIAREIGYPVVLKAESASVIHKSDMGGVAVNLKTEAELLAAVASMQTNIKVADLKFFVQKFMPGGKELIAGVGTKAGLGPMLMFGLGGIYVEVLKDVVFKLAPVTAVEAQEMLSGIKAAKLLEGVRGEKGIDKIKVKELIQRISALVMDYPVIGEMDMNPIMAFHDQVVVVDARIKLK
jgi:acetyltransferase